MTNLETVFDISQHGFENWWFSAIGLLPIIIGFSTAYIFPEKIRKLNPEFSTTPSKIFFGLGIIFTLFAFAGTGLNYLNLHNALAFGQYKTVEGVVENFKVFTKAVRGGGETYESFSVNGVPFEFNDGAVTSAFNQQSKDNGPIRQGEYVKIAYVWLENKNAILKLELQKE